MTEEKVKQQGRPRLDKDTKVSRERVRQIQNHALGKLRKLMYERGYKFEDFFDDKQKGN
jgi:DNA-directed RNA polymerase sigma subunit (sigma70/sigma32)